MKITGTHSADVVGVSIKRNNEQDGREAFVDLEIGVDFERAADSFGAEFQELAFATMRVIEAEGDGVDHVAFLVDRITPGRNVVYERHLVRIDGDELREQPQLVAIKPVDGARRVTARVRLPVDIAKTSLVTMLTQSVGKTLSVEFEPQQASFEFEQDSNGAAKSRKLGRGDAAEAAQ